jgi:hypothetical protein
MAKFTVVGFYDSTGKLFVHHVEAHDSSEAVVACYRTMKEAASDPDAVNPDDLILVEVFKGHLDSQRDDGATCSFSDWPGIAEEG